MFSEISLNHWLILVAMMITIIILYFIIQFLQRKLTQALIPFKKGKSYWCRVIAVSDGDTISCKRLNLRGSETRIRFAYIDAPESSQAFGREAQQMVAKMIHKKIVRIHIVDTDRYGRHVGEIFRLGYSVNEKLVKIGGAWVYESYIRDKKKLARLQKLQRTAKSKKRGLWKQSRPLRPSDYRKNS